MNKEKCEPKQRVAVSEQLRQGILRKQKQLAIRRTGSRMKQGSQASSWQVGVTLARVTSGKQGEQKTSSVCPDGYNE